MVVITAININFAAMKEFCISFKTISLYALCNNKFRKYLPTGFSCGFFMMLIENTLHHRQTDNPLISWPFLLVV